ncbi:DUF262 domain-containing protein [Rhizobium leguminosarum]|uniref:DUF262 domain-containing protein n=1 Tax=Rhizobium leguminosarum TaxID=384 RepID=UPI001031E2BB|nr:DUF262 domain-containing protein [Rhizobium leguminosarum]TAY90230.1 DUF262 domain-containing protein [Rhizobium leguminosarum]
MKTSADNRRIRQLLSGLQSGELQPRPEFQRELVWSNADKLSFLDTVLNGYPFPELYVAVGEVNLETAAGTEMLVDGQQRVTTLHQYFTASPALKLAGGIKPYAALSADEQREFLNYEVAVRNLGIVTADDIKEVFRRINSTSYSLNAMEIANARYNGPLKKCADFIAQSTFFEKHRTFSAREIRRMRDTVYSLTLIISMISTYFHRDDEIETFLEQYNDEFPLDEDVRARFIEVTDLIERTNIDTKSRGWKKTDLLVLIVELDRALRQDKLTLDPKKLGPALEEFYNRVDKEMTNPSGDEDLQAYFKTTVQATNDRGSRVNRGRVIRKTILSAA